MFLDDELYQMCKTSEFNDVTKAKALYIRILHRTEDYMKAKISPSMTDRQLKTAFELTFNLFDSFVRQLKSDPDVNMNMLGNMFEENGFKKAYLSNPEILKVYNSL